MYLVDSSAWIEYLRPGGAEAVKARVRDVLGRDEACSCGVVVLEVLRGARTEKDWAALHEALTALPQLPLDARAIRQAARWGFKLDRSGQTFSTTDLLIAAAAHGRATLLHRHADFTRIAAAVGIREEFVAEAGKS